MFAFIYTSGRCCEGRITTRRRKQLLIKRTLRDTSAALDGNICPEKWAALTVGISFVFTNTRLNDSRKHPNNGVE